MALTRRRWVVLAATLVAAALTARLGVWQLDRAAQKRALQSALSAQRERPPVAEAELAVAPDELAPQLHRRVTLHGRWVPASTVYLDNRQMNQRPGFYVLTPLRLPDGSAVLVQRGWTPRDAMDRTRITVAPPSGEAVVEVQGRIAPGPSRLYEFEAGSSGAIRQNLDLQAFARETGLRLRPFTVLQEDAASSTPDGLLRQWPQPAADVHKHYGYAFQWFAMSALILGLYVWFQLIRPHRSAHVVSSA